MKKLALLIAIGTISAILTPTAGQAASFDFPARPVLDFVRIIIDQPKPPRPEIPRPDRQAIRGEAQLHLERARRELCERIALFDVRLPSWCTDAPPDPTTSSDHLLISEVYYDVDQVHGTETGNEWVELYNGTGRDVNLSGWRINDATSGDSLPAVVLPAGEYAVITNSADTASFWEIPSAAVMVELGSQIGNGLSNAGDAIYLVSPEALIVDAVSWGSNADALAPAAPDVAEGHSLIRVSLSSDTDTAEDWSASDPPNPGQ